MDRYYKISWVLLGLVVLALVVRIVIATDEPPAQQTAPVDSRLNQTADLLQEASVATSCQQWSDTLFEARTLIEAANKDQDSERWQQLMAEFETAQINPPEGLGDCT